METSQTSHMGSKIRRIRELRGMKQEILAEAMGVSQQTVSLLENSAEIEDKKLKEVAVGLGVSVEAIRNFSEEGVINYFNTFNDNALSNSTGAFGHACTFNPLDKMVELFEENKRLFERLVEAEKIKADLFQRLFENKG